MVQTVFPVLRMTDATASLAFYTRMLGFGVDWEYRHAPGFPVFAQLTRQEQSLCLTEHADDCVAGAAVRIQVVDVDACWRAFNQAAAWEVSPPLNTAWDTRELLVIDPDGNRLTFYTERLPA